LIDFIFSRNNVLNINRYNNKFPGFREVLNSSVAKAFLYHFRSTSTKN